MDIITYALAKKYTDKSGGGGATIVANPEGEATDELEKIQIGNNIYSVQDRADTPIIYGFHISDSETNPSEKVTYLEDAIGMTPAYMDFENDIFNYGSWENAFFMPKPCIINKYGEVKAYLNPNNFTEDENGNAVTIDSTLSNANVMIEFPKAYCKIMPDENNENSASIYISNQKIDENYKDFPFIDYCGVHKNHFYMPAYKGSLVNGVMRSVSGAQVSNRLTSEQEISASMSNGDGWYTIDAGEIMYINFLLILIGKSTNTQAVFGKGLSVGGTETINNGFRTGVHDSKGMFYGTNNGEISSGNYENAVKIFGMENWWGFASNRYAGDMLINMKRKIKLCYGFEDGSTVQTFNVSANGYVDIGVTPNGTSGNYISKMKFTKNGMFSQAAEATESTDFCDGQWYTDTTANIYAARGGNSNQENKVGAFTTDIGGRYDGSWWDCITSISYK